MSWRIRFSTTGANPLKACMLFFYNRLTYARASFFPVLVFIATAIPRATRLSCIASIIAPTWYVVMFPWKWTPGWRALALVSHTKSESENAARTASSSSYFTKYA
ncbi:hypothetical protein BDV09DRAFT_172155 [Aspergillus tetrazonus]